MEHPDVQYVVGKSIGASALKPCNDGCSGFDHGVFGKENEPDLDIA
jgi:hypothetical protein